MIYILREKEQEEEVEIKGRLGKFFKHDET